MWRRDENRNYDDFRRDLGGMDRQCIITITADAHRYRESQSLGHKNETQSSHK